MSTFHLNSQNFLGTYNKAQTEIVASGKIKAKYFIRRIGKLYENLNEVIDGLNYCYSFQVYFANDQIYVNRYIQLKNAPIFTYLQIMLSIAHTFIFTQFTVFAYYLAFGTGIDIFVRKTIVRTIWCIFYVVPTIITIYLGSSIIIEVRADLI